MLKTFNAFMTIEWLMPLVGFAELLGGILVLFPKTRALGAVVIFPLIIGILLTNIYAAPEGLPIAITLLLINLWIFYEERLKYKPMVS